jgi:tRNA pseudouridine55 synthase
VAETPTLSVFGRADGLPAPGGAGALLVDKPHGLTSFDVVARVRRALGESRVGHAGTLDPMATGLLVILVGREATRQQDRFMALPKVYTGTLRLGETTPSYDAESAVERRVDASAVTDGELAAAAAALTGEIEQRPPMYSAVKVGGERLYRKARRGEDVEVAPRPTTVYAFDLTGRRGADVDFRIECSKGTYVRSLAHDLGQALGVGAHLVALRREAIGPFTAEEAWKLDDMMAQRGPNNERDMRRAGRPGTENGDSGRSADHGQRTTDQ